MSELKDKVVIVTGAGRGIGRAIAIAAGEAGAKVVVADYGTALDGSQPDPSVAQAVVDEIASAGGVAKAVAQSVATADGARATVDCALQEWGRVDGLVCCAGILRHRPFLELTEFDFDAVISTHVKGHFLMFQSVFAAMTEKGHGGSLIGIGSGYVLGDPSRAPYRTAKAGIVGLAKSVALAGAEQEIRANVISPIADTRMTKASKLQIDALPEDIAPMAIYLLSDRSTGVTGEVFSVSGQTISSWEDPHESRSARHHSRWTAEAIDSVFPWLLGGKQRGPVPVPPLPDSAKPVDSDQ